MQAYLITNKINNKGYVGITTRSLDSRWYEHCNEANSSGRLLHKAINKYGTKAFEIKPIASANTIENLKLVEIELIKQLDTKNPKGYNLTDGGNGIWGYKHSEKTKQKISAEKKGKPWSNETRKKMMESKKGKQSYLLGMGHLKMGKNNNFFKGTVIATNLETGKEIELNGSTEIKNHGFITCHVSSCISGKRKTHKGHIFKRITS